MTEPKLPFDYTDRWRVSEAKYGGWRMDAWDSAGLRRFEQSYTKQPLIDLARQDIGDRGWLTNRVPARGRGVSMKSRTYVGELVWSLDAIAAAFSDTNPNRDRHVREVLTYANKVDVARRCRARLPSRPNLSGNIGALMGERGGAS